MSIFGSLYSSVSGIEAQSTAISIISDNIANVNTTGYKAGSAYFSTLVTNSGAGVAYSPGGVRSQDKQRITQQGLVQSTSSPLDMAISGNGFFIVQNGVDTATSSISYTRAGSFHADSLGNFVNPAGLFLKAWPLDSNGNIPNASASLSSLNVVNIGSASGNATQTSEVKAGINLDAGAKIFVGAGATGKPGSDQNFTENAGITATDILVPNGNLVVGDDISIEINGINTYAFRYGGFEASNDIAAAGTPILGANTAIAPFTGATVGDTFTITRSGDPSNPLTFKYVSGSPTTTNGEFTNLTTLATAINQATGMTARVETNDTTGTVELYIAARDAREGLTFAAGAGASVNFATSLGLSNVAPAGSGINRFASIDGLSSLINNQTSNNVSASLLGATTPTASIKINNAEPLTTIQFADVSNGGSSNILRELNITANLIQPTYDGASTSLTSMASGNVTPSFQRNVTIYDSLGEAHQVNVGFLKTANNNWRAEIYTTDPLDKANGNAQIAAGKVVFNTDGSLASVDSTLTSGIPALTWSNGATSDALTFDYGTAGAIGTGKTDGLRQFSGAYNVDFLTQNGSSAGLLDSVSIDASGFIIANFSNGQTQKLYKIPLADFANPDGMIAKNGNAYIQSFASGEVNLKESGQNGAGSISPSSLEGSNTELSTELTNMIVAQRAYQASAKVITTASQLLDDLNRAIV